MQKLLCCTCAHVMYSCVLYGGYNPVSTFLAGTILRGMFPQKSTQQA